MLGIHWVVTEAILAGAEAEAEAGATCFIAADADVPKKINLP